MEVSRVKKTVCFYQGLTKNVFGITIHELSHASHWEIGYSTGQYVVDWIFRKALIPESWADCVEHVITSSAYSNN